MRIGRVQDVRDGFRNSRTSSSTRLGCRTSSWSTCATRPAGCRPTTATSSSRSRRPKSDDEPVVVTIRRGDGDRADEITVRAKYVVGCDGAHSTVRESIGRSRRATVSDKAWGVMDMLAVTDFPDIRFKATIQSANGGNILLIPREGGYLVRLYVDMGEIAAATPGSRRTRSSIAGARRVLRPYTLDVPEVAWFSVYRVGHRVTDKFDDVDDDEVGTRTRASSSPATPATPTPRRPARA